MPVKIGDLSQISSSLDLTTKIETEDSGGTSYYATLTQIAAQFNIPDSTSDLVNDSGFITGIASMDVTNALGFTPQNASTAFSGDYNDLTNKPSIPSDLADLGDVSATAPTTDQILKFNGTEWAPANESAGGGAVDSVFGRTGSVVAVSGDYAASEITNDSTATGANIKAVLDAFDTSIAAKADSASLSAVATSGDYNDLSNQPTIPTNNNQLTNGAGYIADIIADTTPQLGGDLDGQGNKVSNIARDINTQSGTSYTLVLNDASKYLRFTNAGAISVTIPPNSSVAFVIGTEIVMRQVGAGQVTLVAGSGVTISSPETLKLEKQNATVTLIKTATDTWELDGRLEASA